MFVRNKHENDQIRKLLKTLCLGDSIKELIKKPGKARSKAISNIAKSQGITTSEARRKQAVAIALSSAGKVRK
jgi:hypothetical protein